jgi:hypothetical protein
MEILVKLPATPLRLVTFHLAQSSFAARSTARRHASTIASSGSSQDKRKAYSHTLLLPKTSMPLKHKRPPEEERKFRARSTDELYRRQVCARDPASAHGSSRQSPTAPSSYSMTGHLTPTDTSTWVRLLCNPADHRPRPEPRPQGHHKPMEGAPGLQSEVSAPCTCHSAAVNVSAMYPAGTAMASRSSSRRSKRFPPAPRTQRSPRSPCVVSRARPPARPSKYKRAKCESSASWRIGMDLEESTSPWVRSRPFAADRRQRLRDQTVEAVSGDG